MESEPISPRLVFVDEIDLLAPVIVEQCIVPVLVYKLKVYANL